MTISCEPQQSPLAIGENSTFSPILQRTAWEYGPLMQGKHL